MKTTRKKTRIIGKQTYIHQETGELCEMNVIEESEKDCNFHKLWLGHIIQSLDLIGNKKIDVLIYISNNLNSENIFIMTQRTMAKKIGVSYATVAETMKALQESNFLKQIQSGVYQVNPNILFKGSKDKRMNILIKYNQED